MQGGCATGHNRHRGLAGAVNLVDLHRVEFIHNDFATRHNVQTAGFHRGVGCTAGPGRPVTQGDCAGCLNGERSTIGKVFDPDIATRRHNAHAAHRAGDAVDDDVAVGNDVHLAAGHIE